jgi:hypothetical protein
VSQLTIPLAAMAVLAGFGLVCVLVFNVLRVMWLRNAIDKTTARRDDEAAALEVLRQELAEVQAEVARRRLRRQHQLNRVDEARRRLDRARGDRVEYVHEIGEPGHGLRAFRADLALVPGFADAKPEEVPFGRDLWKRRNVAEIWAASLQGAAGHLARAFPPASGVVAAEIVETGDAVGDEPAPVPEGGP